MHVALLGDVPLAGGGMKPLLQWQDAHRRRLQGSIGAAPSCWVCATMYSFTGLPALCSMQ